MVIVKSAHYSESFAENALKEILHHDQQCVP